MEPRYENHDYENCEYCKSMTHEQLNEFKLFLRLLDDDKIGCSDF